MKKSIRILALLLAFTMVVLPLIACDTNSSDNKETTASDGGKKTPMEPTDIPDDDFEDKIIAKHSSPDKNYYIRYIQLTAHEDGIVGVSLTLYAKDDTELDSVEFYFKKDGNECVAKDVERVTWNSNKTADVKMANEVNATFTLSDKRG